MTREAGPLNLMVLFEVCDGLAVVAVLSEFGYIIRRRCIVGLWEIHCVSIAPVCMIRIVQGCARESCSIVQGCARESCSRSFCTVLVYLETMDKKLQLGNEVSALPPPQSRSSALLKFLVGISPSLQSIKVNDAEAGTFRLVVKDKKSSFELTELRTIVQYLGHLEKIHDVSSAQVRSHSCPRGLSISKPYLHTISAYLSPLSPFL